MREREQNIREEEEGDEERNRTDERTEEYERGEGVQDRTDERIEEYKRGERERRIEQTRG